MLPGVGDYNGKEFQGLIISFVDIIIRMMLQLMNRCLRSIKKTSPINSAARVPFLQMGSRRFEFSIGYMITIEVSKSEPIEAGASQWPVITIRHDSGASSARTGPNDSTLELWAIKRVRNFLGKDLDSLGSDLLNSKSEG